MIKINGDIEFNKIHKGYKYAIAKHPASNSNGVLYEHRYIACLKENRLLSSNECVHHIDRNKSNNHPDNLLVLSFEDHCELHYVEDFLGKKWYPGCIERYGRKCKCCNNVIVTKRYHGDKFCSDECVSEFKRKNPRTEFNPSPEELEMMVWEMPVSQLCKIKNISDSAISKRCKKLGIEKPPVGYWAKVKAGKIEKMLPPSKR